MAFNFYFLHTLWQHVLLPLALVESDGKGPTSLEPEQEVKKSTIEWKMGKNRFEEPLERKRKDKQNRIK